MPRARRSAVEPLGRQQLAGIFTAASTLALQSHIAKSQPTHRRVRVVSGWKTPSGRVVKSLPSRYLVWEGSRHEELVVAARAFPSHLAV